LLCRQRRIVYAVAMKPRPRKLVTMSRIPAATIAALSMLVTVVDRAASQIAPAPVASPMLGVQEQGQPPGPPPSSPQAESAPQASPQPAEKPGLFNEMGKMFEKSLSVLPSLQSTGEAIDDLNTRAKDAVKGAGDALSRVAKPGSMVSGRMICPMTAGGTPDCKTGADRLCQSKGFKEGNSLNTDSTQSCSAKVMIPGRQRQASDCRTDNYVTSALCL
jgi:hypothetical protein